MTICRFFILFSILIFLSYSGISQSQSIKFNLVNGMNGISLGKINSITQDRDGAMWFSDQTNRCITRYDGTNMVRYLHNPQDSNALGGSYPEVIAIDSNGIIWIGFWGFGLDRFDPATNTFTHFRHDEKDSGSLSDNTVSNIIVDHQNNIWVGTKQGLDLFDRATGTFKHFRHDPNDPKSLSHDHVRALYEDRQGGIWVGTGFFWNNDGRGGLNKLDRASGSFLRYVHEPGNVHSLIDNKVRAIFEDSYGNLWIGTGKKGLHTLDRATGRITRQEVNLKQPDQFTLPEANSGSDQITFITEDAEKCLWIGTLSNGLARFIPLTKTWIQYTRELSLNLGFKDNSGWMAHSGRDGWLWISTQESSLYKVDLYKMVVDFVSGYTSYVFLDKDNDILYLASWEGLRRKNLKTGEERQISSDPAKPGSLLPNVTQIYKAPDRSMWLSTDKGLWRFDERTESLTQYTNNPGDSHSLSSDYISELLMDSQNNFWVGTYGGGLNLFDPKTGKCKRFQTLDSDSTGAVGYFVTSITEGIEKDIWLGCWENKGIRRMNPSTQKFKSYLPGVSVVGIRKDSKGQLWAGSETNIYQYNPIVDSFTLYTQAGMPITLNGVSSFIIDQQDHLWLISTSGIIRIDPKTEIFVIYDKENGFSAQQYPYSSASVLSDGSIAVGNFEGYYIFDPVKLNPPKGIHKIVLTDLQINGRPVIPGAGKLLTKNLNDTRDIHLAYHQNVFSVSFSATDFNAPEAKRYYGKLEPYETEWKEVDPDQPMNYFNVPPGEYTLMINAINTRHGTHVQKKINILISPPWWKTWWAYTLFAIGIIFIAYFIHRTIRGNIIRQERERNRARELAQAKEIEKAYHDLKNTQTQLIQAEKMASLGELTAGIAHEIQNPLNFVNNFSEVSSELLDEMKQELATGNKQQAIDIADDVKQNLDKIIYHGRRADGIVKGMLQHSRTGTGQKEPTDINALADEYLRLAYHGMRAKDKSFNVNIKTDFDDSIGKIEVVPQDIGRVLLNLITNAFHALSAKSSALQTPYPLKGGDEFVPTVSISTKKLLPLSGGRGSEETNGFTQITISDNGPGIPEAIKEKIFQPFFTTKPTGQGTGLGLSLSYDIVKAHGGEIKVESKESEGTTFIIQLPLKTNP